jgi:ABC-type molybdate transport system permease subunit
MDWSAIQLSLRLSTLTMLLLLILGLPLASWLAFSQWRWKFCLEAVVTLPIVLPPTVLGFYVLIQALDYGAASQTALALLLFSFMVLAITYGLQRRVIAVWPPR